MAETELCLYVRQDCHLCDEMARELAPWCRRLSLRLRLVDIDTEAELVKLYSHKVPVLTHGDFEICHYFLDEAELLARVSAVSDRPQASDSPQGEATSRYRRIYDIVCQIPPGRVATYGQVAAIEGNSTARMAGYAMAAVDDPEVPWHRVLNHRGMLSERSGGGGTSEQRRRLEAEGVLFDPRGRVDFERVAWTGPDYDWLERHNCQPVPTPHRS